MVIITEKGASNGKEFEVYEERLGKGKIHLHTDDCAEALLTKACACTRSCHETIDNVAGVRERRVEFFSQCRTELEATERLVTQIKGTRGDLRVSLPGGEARLVCRKYYAKLHGVSVKKLKGAMTVVKHGGRASVLRSTERRKQVVPVKYNTAHAFWELFFSENCQSPNDEIRLFPADHTYPQIYKDYFEPWWARQVLGGNKQEKEKPQFGTWKNARRAPEFKDVKERAKHFHSTCKTCRELKDLLLEAFKTGKDEAEYRQRRRQHNAEVRAWRLLEEHVKAKAVNSPDRYTVIMHDATGALGLPKMRHRVSKGLNPSRFEVVPWLGIDYSQRKRMDYIYAPKLHTVKDVNYLLSMLHPMIRRTKSDYTKENYKARHLIVIADSASENKGNTIFAYYADMVDAGWYDSVELLFGPVGHTHNGVDAVHKIHNVNLGGMFSGDLGHLVHNYSAAWGREPPGANILRNIVDWTAYYADILRNMLGFRKSSAYKYSCVRGFRIARQADNTIDLCYKPDPGLDPKWLGRGGFENQPGYFLLKSKPLGLPAEVPLRAVETPNQLAEKIRHLNAPGWQTVMSAQNLLPCIEENCQALLTGIIPVHRRQEEEKPPGELGVLCEVGAVEGKRGMVRVIDDLWDRTQNQADRTTLWALPLGQNDEHKVARGTEFHCSRDAELRLNAPFPLVRQGPLGSSEVARHARGLATIKNRAAPKQKQTKSSNRAATGTGNKAGGKRKGGGGGNDEETPGRTSGQRKSRNRETNPANHGTWLPDSTEASGYRFDVDFDGCKTDKFVLSLMEHDVGKTPTIFVGKVVSVDSQNKTCMAKKRNPSKNPWSPECLDGQWNNGHRSAKAEEVPGYSVIAYFDKFIGKGKNTLPGPVKTAVRERSIAWWQEEDEEKTDPVEVEAEENDLSYEQDSDSSTSASD
jgi:hypothetical protein